MNAICKLRLDAFSISRDGSPVVFPRVFHEICPALLHASIPYLFAFKEGATFAWERDIHAVHACCPAGHVDARISRPRGPVASIRVIRASYRCPRHSHGDRLVVPVNVEALGLIDALYPCLLSVQQDPALAVKFLSMRREEVHVRNAEPGLVKKPVSTPCDWQAMLGRAFPRVNVAGMKRTCAHHRHTGLVLEPGVLPRGACVFLYHAAYPAFLSMLYGGCSPGVKLLACPGILNHVDVALVRTARASKPLLSFLEKLLRFFHFPQDIIKERVEMKVVRVTGNCPKGMKEGDSITLGGNQVLCASSFDVLFDRLLHASRAPSSDPLRCTCTSLSCRVQYTVSSCEIKIDARVPCPVASPEDHEILDDNHPRGVS